MLTFELSRAYPDMEVTFFDVPPVVDLVQKNLVPDEVTGITFVAGSCTIYVYSSCVATLLSSSYHVCYVFRIICIYITENNIAACKLSTIWQTGCALKTSDDICNYKLTFK